MIRRVIAALLLLSSVHGSAFPRVLVVVPRNNNDIGAGDVTTVRNAWVQRSTIASVLDGFGAEYDVVSASVGKTEFCRLGVVTYNFGTSAAFTRSYTAVIHIGLEGTFGGNTGYRADSLFSSTKLPLVPQLYVGWSYSWRSAACACSIGVANAAGYNNATNHLGWTKYSASDPSLRFRSGYLDGVSLAAPYLGTVRGIIKQGSNVANAQSVLPTVPLPCMDCDSLTQSTNTDSVAIYVRQNDHVPGKAPIIVSVAAHNWDDQQDPAMSIAAIALLDSLAGGTIIKRPLRFGINVRGAFRRNAKHVMGGFVSGDSATIKASIDSLASLGVRFTVGVNIDSVSTYPDELFWWNRAPLALYSPESWSGIDTTVLVAANGKATYGRSLDLYGRYRTRALLGALSGTEGDSALSSGVRRAFSRTDSIFSGRSDRVMIPALGDWCPRNIGANGLDSLWYALGKTGSTALVVSPWEPESNPNRSTNPLGVLPQQTAMKSSLGGEPIRLLASAPYPDSGSATFESGNSVDSYFNNPSNSWVKHVQSFWSTLIGVRGVQRGASNGTTVVDTDARTMFDNFSKAKVLTIHAGDLGSGLRSDAQSRPTRPGWWYVKSVVNEAKAINKLAGRSVVQIVPLQDLWP